MSKSNLQKAIRFAGGQTQLAKLVGVKQAHVWGWANTTINGVPAEYVIPISAGIDWQVTPHDLRPDIYPHPHDGLPEHLRQAA